MLKASWKFSLGLQGLRVEYSKASGKKRCTRAQKAMPSLQLEEKFWMLTPCFRADSGKTRGAGSSEARPCNSRSFCADREHARDLGTPAFPLSGCSSGNGSSAGRASSPRPSSGKWQLSVLPVAFVLSSFQVASFCNLWLVCSCIYLQIRGSGGV